jgi:hypothetical protein
MDRFLQFLIEIQKKLNELIITHNSLVYTGPEFIAKSKPDLSARMLVPKLAKNGFKSVLYN